MAVGSLVPTKEATFFVLGPAGIRGQESGVKSLVTLSAAKGLDSILKRFFAALRMTERADP
jgi:hypothetical protein